jgi:hypothetical protein
MILKSIVHTDEVVMLPDGDIALFHAGPSEDFTTCSLGELVEEYIRDSKNPVVELSLLPMAATLEALAKHLRTEENKRTPERN